jgi:hypothetical protein
MSENFTTGQKVQIECDGRTLPGSVVFASSNGKSLMLGFDAMLAGHLGMMPVLRDDDGIYHSIMTDVSVTLKPLKEPP